MQGSRLAQSRIILQEMQVIQNGCSGQIPLIPAQQDNREVLTTSENAMYLHNFPPHTHTRTYTNSYKHALTG